MLDGLARRGFRCVGPQLRDGTIVYDDLTTIAQLPVGISDDQAPGTYVARKVGSPRCFAWANGPQALKPFLFAPQEPLWRAERRDGHIAFTLATTPGKPLACIGVRACDLAALALQDAHFLQLDDPYYAARRENLFIVAVDCTHPAPTCFCASTGDGPATQPGCEHGYDIALNELDAGYVARSGSTRGAELLAELELAAANASQIEQAQREVRRAAEQQTRALPGRNLRDALFANLDHARWQDVAQRCLSCGNCTLVCPTCFCHRQDEQPTLDGGASEHVRTWDSCFTEGHSHLHGHTVRPDTRLRYRQWLTHKLGSWHDQYGRSGCVGCGRCITWCPVGIDITEKATQICGSDHDE